MSAQIRSPVNLPVGTDELAAIFLGLPRVMFSIKDLGGRYLMVNQAFADRAGRKSPSEIVGKTASDLFVPELALSYEAQDADVAANGRPVRRQLELINRPDGSLGWYITNKVLIRAKDSSPVAIAAVSLDEQLRVERSGVRGLEAAVRTAHERFKEPITSSDLAAAGSMTTLQLVRVMRRHLGVPPRQLIARVRVEEALHSILYTSMPLAEIANECGFSDQAAMSRQVKQMVGVSPKAMRQARHRATQAETELLPRLIAPSRP